MITVNTTGDVFNPNDPIERDAQITLREAVAIADGELLFADLSLAEQALVTPTPGVVFDTIVFDIPAAQAVNGIWTIQLMSQITINGDDLIIDGPGQVGLAAGPAPVVAVTPTFSYGLLGGDGLAVFADRVTIEDLSIYDFKGANLSVRGSENRLQRNYLGADPTGTSDSLTIDTGVAISPFSTSAGTSLTASQNTISDNLISGNQGVGVEIVDGNDNTIQGNQIGTNAAGTVPLANDVGVRILQSPSPVTAGPQVTASRNLIADNLISGNSTQGVFLQADDNRVEGNRIGTNAAGTAALGNGLDGISINSLTMTNGTATYASGNVINDNTISGNGQDGINITDVVFVNRPGTTVTGNRIGTGINGTSSIPNDRDGVRLDNAYSNTIGGVAAAPGPIGTGNTIAFNGNNGVSVIGGFSNPILRNSIYSNNGLGIDLNDDGVTLNDLLDTDSGGNDLQNFPDLTSAVSTGGTTTVTGTLTSASSTLYRVEFFSDAGDPSGFGEGRFFLGSMDVMTDSSGTMNFTAVLPMAAAPGRVISATATDPSGNTSEFSNDVPLLADLVLTKTDDPDPVAVGQPLTYTIGVTNLGPSDASQVTLSDMLPPTVTFVSLSPSSVSYTISGGVLTADLGTIAPNELVTLTLVVQPNVTGILTNQATVTANEFTSDTATEMTTVENAGQFAFSQPSYSVNENGSSAAITVNRLTGAGGPVMVHIATRNGTAIDGVDYVGVSQDLQFAPGEMSQTIFVPIIDDNIDGPDKTVFIDLSMPTGGASLGDPSTSVLTIIDDDPPPSVSINDAPPVIEGNTGTTNAVFTVMLSGPSEFPIMVAYATMNGTATAGEDYVATSGTLTFDPDTTTQTILVPVIGDRTVENTETFSVVLSDPVNVTIARGQGIGTIVNDDAATISINDAPPVNEGDAGTTNAVFTVTLSAPSDFPIMVAYATMNGTATAGEDYVATSGTLTFDPGTTTRTILVPVIGDRTVENTETFSVVLSDPVNATIARGVGIGTIVNDDVNTVSINNISVVEGDVGTTPAVFTVTLSNPVDRPFSVAYNTADGTAKAGQDYIPTSGTLTFAPGETTKTITVQVLGDFLIEGNETFCVILTTANLDYGNYYNYLNYLNNYYLDAGESTHELAKGVCTIIDDDSVIVTNTNDQGQGSLRKALLVSNATPGQDRIIFQIPGEGVQTIRPLSPLPIVEDPVIIDGYTQPGSHPNTSATGGNAVILVALDGGLTSGQVSGLVIPVGNSVVQGLAIHSFPITGISLLVHGGNTIRGNYIGTDASGTRALGNGVDGLFLADSSDNTIGGTDPADRNLISGNRSSGIQILGNVPISVGTGPDEQLGTADDETFTGDASRNLVQGNFLGTDVTGTAKLGNVNDGVFINNASRNTIGGAGVAAGNLISGNGSVGLQIFGTGATGNVVQGNKIGTDVTGNVALGNARDGVFVNAAPNNLIGGDAAGTGNIISGNGFSGVDIANAGATGNLVLGNAIGTNFDRTARLGNAGDGVLIENTTGNTVGGTAPNIIAFNGFSGIQIVLGGMSVTATGANGNRILNNIVVGNDVAIGNPAAFSTIPNPHAHPTARTRPFAALLAAKGGEGNRPWWNLWQARHVNIPTGTTRRGPWAAFLSNGTASRFARISQTHPRAALWRRVLG